MKPPRDERPIGQMLLETKAPWDEWPWHEYPWDEYPWEETP